MTSVKVWLALPSGANLSVGTLREVQPAGYRQPTLDFSYDADYFAHPEAYELSADLPAQRGAQLLPLDRQMFSGLADSLPDAWGRRLIKHEHARQARASGGPLLALHEIDYLLRQSDTTRIGALRFSLEGDETFVAESEAELPELQHIVEAAVRFENDEATDDDLHLLAGISSPLGGARPKVNWVTDGHPQLVKLWSSRDRALDIEAWEAVTLTIAAEAGLIVPTFSHQRRNESLSLLLIDRFDRDGETRIGYQSMRHAMALGDAADGASSYQQMAEFVAFHSVQPNRDLEQLFLRAAVSIAINDCDDHLKNFGFLNRGTGWSLAPAFDINPGVPEFIEPSDTWVTRTADRSRLHDFSALIDDADSYALQRDSAAALVHRVRTATLSWRSIAEHFGIAHTTISRFASAFVSQ